jgi:tetratricopeptide (TPR) repeat protein
MNAYPLFVALLAAQPAVAQDSVRLYSNLGDYHRVISTKVPATQQYFDQGLRLAYGFNHEEAIRSFREAARRDPNCATCWWGVAFAYGPNINLPMDSASNAAAVTALQSARGLLMHTTPVERAYIEALELRYGANAGPAGDSAYARGMADVARRFPDDQDAQVLAADAAMLLRPWNYWQKDGQPYPGTMELVNALERVIDANPNHPGACHFYIHAMEAAQPEKAVACAERLAALMPGAGHLVHMPAHIYIRVGRWNDAIEANQHAVHADEEFLSMEKPAGIYPLAYYPHNHHFLSFAAAMAGRSALALDHAQRVRASIPVEAAAAFNIFEPLLAYPYLTMVTFGKWDDVLREKDPPENLRITTALAAYAKGVAHAVRRNGDVARQHLSKVAAIAAELTPAAGEADAIVDIAHHALAGEIAYRAGLLREAETHYRAAMQVEDAFNYTEPPQWYYPIRHSLGALLLDAKRFDEAEQVYREDLKRFPGNVWALAGLVSALHGNDKHGDAAEIEQRLGVALREADVRLMKSRF